MIGQHDPKNLNISYTPYKTRSMEKSVLGITKQDRIKVRMDYRKVISSKVIDTVQRIQSSISNKSDRYSLVKRL